MYTHSEYPGPVQLPYFDVCLDFPYGDFPYTVLRAKVELSAPPGTPVSSTRKLISSSSFHRLDMTLAVAEALNPNKPNRVIGYIFPRSLGTIWHVLPCGVVFRLAGRADG